jgi:hypothetical protein
MNYEMRDISITHPDTGELVPGHVRVEETYSVTVPGASVKNITVFYGGRSHGDTFDYRLDQDGYMMAMAHQLLWEMVTGRALNSRPAVCPA